MRIFLLIIGCFISSLCGLAQGKTLLNRIDLEIGTGIGFDFFDYLGRNDVPSIQGPFDLPDPAYRDYSDRNNRLVKEGRIDQYALSYRWNEKNRITLGVKYFYWEEYFGWKKDRLELWKDIKETNERRMYSLNWSRNVIGKRGSFEYGIGVVYQLQVISDPRYWILNNQSVRISASDFRPFFPDIGLNLTLTKYWDVLPGVQLGLRGYTHALLGIGFDSSALLLSTKIGISPEKESQNEIDTQEDGLTEESRLSMALSYGSGIFKLLRYGDDVRNTFGEAPGYEGNVIEEPNGKRDRFGLIFSFQNWNAEIAYSLIRYKELIGSNNDPLAFWSETRNLQKQHLLDFSIGYNIGIDNKLQVIPQFGLVARKDIRFSQFYDLNLDDTLNSIGLNVIDTKWEVGLNLALGLEYEISTMTSLGVKSIVHHFDNDIGIESISLNGYVRLRLF